MENAGDYENGGTSKPWTQNRSTKRDTKSVIRGAVARFGVGIDPAVEQRNPCDQPEDEDRGGHRRAI